MTNFRRGSEPSLNAYLRAERIREELEYCIRGTVAGLTRKKDREHRARVHIGDHGGRNEGNEVIERLKWKHSWKIHVLSNSEWKSGYPGGE